MSKLDKTKFLEAKAQGKNNTAAALQAGAITKQAAHKAGYRLNKELGIQNQINKAIKQNGVDIKYLIGIYVEATKAEITDRDTGEITPNYNVRMKAADRLFSLSGIEHQLKHENPMSPNTTPLDTKDIEAALRAGNIVEAQRLVFKKRD